MNLADCPLEPALWPATAGEDVAPAVAAHLQQCAQCAARVTQLREQRGQLATAADIRVPDAQTESIGTTSSASAARAADELPEWIGRYRVQRLLSLGGQAEIYLARHPTLRGNVVVKWAHVTVQQSPRTAQRFADEARLLAQLRHRNLVGVHDVGIAAGRPYLVMEHVSGSVLSRTGPRPFPPRDAAAIVARIARALHAVHEAGRLHLDVQPENILIDSDGEPRLIDFGLAVGRGAEPDDPHDVARGGTPEYMAPEQLAGETARIDVQTDIYALGAVLHELLTGSRPQPEYPWESATSAARGVTNHHVPPALRRICRRALDPEPARRFPTALESAGRSPASFRRIAAVVLALACLPAALASLWPPSGSAAPHPQSPLAIPCEPRAAAAQFLSRAGDGRVRVHLYLQDGHCVPVGVERTPPGSDRKPPERIPQLIRDLFAMQGTALVAVLPGESGDLESRPRIAPRSITSLPPLPAGTLARITDHDIRVLACGATPASLWSSALPTSGLRRIQTDLLKVAPQFEALLFATGTATDAPAAPTGGAP